jgi:predicted nicotinamide N-methyase
VSAGLGDRDPYWAVVWASAIALGNLVLAQPDFVRGQRVAEFGCGLGLAGIVCAMAGATHCLTLFQLRALCVSESSQLLDSLLLFNAALGL